jgi:hypothetical protein
LAKESPHVKTHQANFFELVQTGIYRPHIRVTRGSIWSYVGEGLKISQYVNNIRVHPSPGVRVTYSTENEKL